MKKSKNPSMIPRFFIIKKQIEDFLDEKTRFVTT